MYSGQTCIALLLNLTRTDDPLADDGTRLPQGSVQPLYVSDNPLFLCG